MNYEEMSDREVEFLVWIAGDSEVKHYINNGKILISVKDSGDQHYEDVPRYCRNPSDAWPIILLTGMSIELAHVDLGGVGTCTIYNSTGTDWQCDFYDNEQALRAAMICFLKMKGC